MVKTGLFEAIDSLVPLDEHFCYFSKDTDTQEKEQKRKLTTSTKHYMERAKIKSKLNGKDQVKSKSKVIRMKKIQLEGLKLPSLKLYYKRLKRQGPKLPTGQRLQLSYKTSGDQTAYSPKKSSFPPNKPRYNLYVAPYFFPAKPLLSLAKIISSTLLTPPSCINAMLAIPLHSQSISMVEIVSKEAQKKSKAGICFRLSSHNKHTCFYLYKEAQAASPRLRL
ncbi:hypothetical protein Tco_0811111 [Tanacetum coccineum]